MNRNKRRWIRRSLGVLAVTYALVMTFGGCASTILLRAPSGQFDAGGATRQLINVNGTDIEVWTSRSEAARNDEPEGFVLEFCGNATRAEHIASFVPARWKRVKVETWVVNYPGVGGSGGKRSLSAIPSAAVGVYDVLKVRAGTRPVFVEANSLGTTAALHVAAERPVAGCILQNPVPLRKLLIGEHGWWNAWLIALPVALQVPRELDSIANAARCKAPAIFLLADHDEVVPPKYHKMITDAYAGPKEFITLVNATHNDSVPREAEVQLQQQLEALWARSQQR
ncbi:MAG TPA: alpha/beta hydrolase [Tepidisphaeraceae bacterium]|jgi:hypothetical protein